ncbi:MAG: alpha/beta fold hydrolase [Corynebacteriales bacterium]|nr:alpha/beta fold hydrolase [Mycobacteriales bacterium]
MTSVLSSRRIIGASAAVIGLALALTGLGPSPAQSADQLDKQTVKCQDARVPVTVPGVSDATIFGTLCTPTASKPTAVHLLVPGSTMTQSYFDWPDDSRRYSYVRKATSAGYATFSIDRLGSGKSTRPLSTTVTMDAGADTLHEVVTALRAGKVGGTSFSKVIWVGHSLGSIYAWAEAAKYQDIDAFVLTAMTHSVKPSFLPLVSNMYHPVTQDPKFANSGYDAGYLTTKPGTRPDQFFYTQGADQTVINRDEQLKDTVSGTEFNQAVALITSPPADTAPSRAIRVPTLLVVGDQDPFFCGSPDGIECTKQRILETEKPYYHSDAKLEVVIASDSGHNVQVHRSSPTSTTKILDWVSRTVPRS